MTVNQTTLGLFPGAIPGRAQHEDRSVRSKAKQASAGDTYRSDPALIEACLSGDKAAWQTLVERYGRLIYSIPRRYSLSAEDSDDVFQNVVTIAFRQLDRLRDPTCLSAWLITITHRECRRFCKRSGIHIELTETIQDPTALDSDHFQRSERQLILHQALSRLDPRSQELLNALFFDATQPSYREIADRLGMAEGSVAPTRSRCFKKLEAILLSLSPGLFP